MVRSAARKVMWVGRATVFLVGLAVILALVLGVAAAALAGTGVGDTFDLGKSNTVNRISKLVGSTDNAMLRVDNNNAGTNATALDLMVEPGHAPMEVNSTTKVNLLNADLVDGLGATSFIRSGIYRKQTTAQAGTNNNDGTWSQAVSCDPGDILLSGGPADIHATTDIVESFPIPNNSGTMVWTVRVQKNGVDDNFVVVALCANQ